MKFAQYRAAFAIASPRANRARAAVLGRIALYTVLLAMYARIWQVVGARGSLGVFGHRDLIWYLALTEWVTLSIPPLRWDLESDAPGRAIAYFFSRPLSYSWLRFSEALGTMLLRMALLGIFGFTVAWLLASDATSVGALPSGGALALICGAFAALFAALLNLVFSTLIGLSTLLIQDTSSVDWFFEKLSFVFGGPFPLAPYPDAFQHAAAVTPGKLALSADTAFVWRSLLLLGGWGLVGVGATHFGFGRARKSQMGAR